MVVIIECRYLPHASRARRVVGLLSWMGFASSLLLNHRQAAADGIVFDVGESHPSNRIIQCG